MSFLDIEIKHEYRSLLNNVVEEFYIPVLNEAVIYKRAVGFFSSTALIELTNGINGLLSNGGKIELVASPRLSAEDILAIEDGFERREEVIEKSLIRELLAPVGKFQEERLNLLSNLIASRKLELKIAILEKDNNIGMFHEKMGLMYDQNNNIIAFAGSMNESANAFSCNYESIDIFTSWSNDKKRVLSKEFAFNSIWNDCEPNIKVINFPSVEKEIIRRYQRSKIFNFSNVAEVLDQEEGISTVKQVNNYPNLPKDVKVRPYQNQAIIEWEKEGFVGIFDMATGERVIIVMGAVFMIKSRVSGTLTKYISCIA